MDIPFTVRRKHNLKSVLCDPYHCALRTALMDVPGVEDARIDAKKSLVLRSGTWYKTATPPDMVAALLGFDRGKMVRPGTDFVLFDMLPVEKKVHTAPCVAPGACIKEKKVKTTPQFMIRRVNGISKRVPLQA